MIIQIYDKRCQDPSFLMGIRQPTEEEAFGKTMLGRSTTDEAVPLDEGSYTISGAVSRLSVALEVSYRIGADRVLAETETAADL